MADNNALDYEYEVYPDGRDEEQSLLDPVRKAKQPQDRGYFVFFIFGFLGLASLLPWNFFITAKRYFDYKFRNTSLPVNTTFDAADHQTHLQYTFESYLSIVSNGCNLFLMILTALLVRWISVKVRIIGASILIIIIFIATSCMVKVNTDSWQDNFLVFTLVMASFMSGGQSVLTGSILGLSAVFPVIYSQSAMIGQAAGGTFTAIVSIFTHWVGGDPVTSGFTYFLIATAVTILALLTYLCLYRLTFSKHFMTVKKETVLKPINNEKPSGLDESKVKFLWTVFKKIWVYFVSVCLVFFVTLAVFPSVCSLIVSVNSLMDTYFTPVVCFLLFNVGDFVGRLFTFVCKFPGSNRPNLLLVLTILRIAFIPLLMLCNTNPRYHLPVVLDDDAWPIILISLMGLSNGYLGTLCMSFGPTHVDHDEAEGAGILLALAITVGLASGSFLSILLVSLL